MTAPDGFAALILTHGRPDRVFTHRFLRKHGYTGPIHLVIDDEDETGDEYRAEYGEEYVHVFSKDQIEQTFDTADTSTDRRTIVYARNASFDIARSLGLRYFIQLDDDYDWFGYRFLRMDQTAGSTPVSDLDALFQAMIDLLEDTGAATVAMSQGGDHIGGGAGPMAKGKVLRKAMNSFVFRTDRPVEFLGRINEDVNTYVTHGSRGALFFTSLGVQLHQKQTQSNAGGMTDIYLASGTYLKSFYTVMMAPSCVKVGRMGPVSERFHHHVLWEQAVPKIISGRYRKP